MTYKEWVIMYDLVRFPSKSYTRFADKAYNRIIRANYMDNKKGIPLDVQARDISEDNGIEITIEDLVDFVNTYLRNPVTRKIKPYYEDDFYKQY